MFLIELCFASFQLGTTAVGIQTSEGVVLAAEKRIGSKLLVPSSVKKLVQLDGRASTRQHACALAPLTLAVHGKDAPLSACAARLTAVLPGCLGV